MKIPLFSVTGWRLVAVLLDSTSLGQLDLMLCSKSLRHAEQADNIELPASEGLCCDKPHLSNIGMSVMG